jgi:transposase
MSLNRKGKASARTLKRALVLLAADEDETHAAIATKLRLHGDTVADISRRFLEYGLAAALYERPRPGKARLLGPREEAHLVAITCSNPPEGRTHWTMQLLADRLVALKVVESISDETVRRTLKKGAQALAV